MLCKGNHLTYKPRNELYIHKTIELESTFIELINTKRPNIIIGAIYRHPNMELDAFNDIYLNILLDKILKKRKSFFLLDGFNLDLLKYDHHALTNEFLDSFSSHMFLLHIIQLVWVTSNSKTIIDSIFSNILDPGFISGNLTFTDSDHLPQFIIVQNIFSNPPSFNKSNIYEWDWNNFDEENLILEY